MKKRLTPEEKQELVARYQMGEPVKSLCKEAGVSKSSFYEWIGQYRENRTLSALRPSGIMSGYKAMRKKPTL